MNPFIKNEKEVIAAINTANSRKQVILGDVPSKSNCYKIITFKSKDPSKKSHASLAKTPALIQYEKNFFIQCGQYRNAGIDEYFKFQMDVYYPNQRKDLDNSLKIVLDCLQKNGAIKNDNLCVDIHVRKFVDANNPRVEFVISKAMQ
jgi:Holliday junction resolvase RusA-like endonuclease